MLEHIKTEENDDHILVTLRGQFIGGEETDKLRYVLGGIAEQDKNRAIVDMGKVTYLNSTALGVLISAHAKFTKRNGKIVLCNISSNIENIFVITKLTLVFDIVDTLVDAEKLLSNS